MASTTSYFINAALIYSLTLSLAPLLPNYIHYSWNLINFTTQFSMPKQFTDQTLLMCVCVCGNTGLKTCVSSMSSRLTGDTHCVLGFPLNPCKKTWKSFFHYKSPHEMCCTRYTFQSRQLIPSILIELLCSTLRSSQSREKKKTRSRLMKAS